MQWLKMRRRLCAALFLLAIARAATVTRWRLRANGTFAVNISSIVNDYDDMLLYVPDDAGVSKATALVVVLHGWGNTGESAIDDFGAANFVGTLGFVLAGPQGRFLGVANPGCQTGWACNANISYWTASRQCCGPSCWENGAPLGCWDDDEAYLAAVIAQLRHNYGVPRVRTLVWGFSNGGFMAHRLACMRAALVGAIVPVNGVLSDAVASGGDCDYSCGNDADPSIHYLGVHGADDLSIPWDGRADGDEWRTDAACEVNSMPSVRSTVLAWVSLNGCDDSEGLSDMRVADEDDDDDLSDLVAGGSTTWLYRANCTAASAGGSVELWKLIGEDHSPSWNASGFPRAMLTWFFATIALAPTLAPSAALTVSAVPSIGFAEPSMPTPAPTAHAEPSMERSTPTPAPMAIITLPSNISGGAVVAFSSGVVTKRPTLGKTAHLLFCLMLSFAVGVPCG